MTSVVSSTHYCYVALLRLLFYDLCGICDVASVGHRFPTFRTNILPSYSRIQVSSLYSIHLKVNRTLLRNVGHQLPIVAASHPRRRGLSTSPLGEPQNTVVTCLLFRKSVTRMEAGVFVLFGWKYCMDDHRRRSA